jgi:hypothetical protein
VSAYVVQSTAAYPVHPEEPVEFILANEVPLAPNVSPLPLRSGGDTYCVAGLSVAVRCTKRAQGLLLLSDMAADKRDCTH